MRARRRRENYSEKRRQAERDRARMNRQRQREREIQRQREQQQNNDMMTESVVLMSLWPRAINILISNWSRTRKFSQSFKNTSREDRGFSRHSHALITVYDRPICMLWLVKIWQLSSCRIWFIQHLQPCLLSVWQLKLWYFLLSFSTGCLKWNTAAINSLLWFMVGLFIEFLVGKSAGCQSWKSDFGCIAFVFTLLDAGWKVPQAILALLYSVQELHLEW